MALFHASLNTISTMSTPAPTMQDVMAALGQLQQENQDLRAALAQVQNPGTTSYTSTHNPEPKISLPNKFDGTRQNYRGFINQVKLIIQLHPHRYPSEQTKVGLVGTLLSGTALSWFAPLMETQSPLLSDFAAFLVELEATFGNADKERSSATKIRALKQGVKLASTYAAEFRLLACDLNWGEPALISQFQYGLRENIKDLLLTMSDPSTLTEAIHQAVKCDNRLFERQQQRNTTPFYYSSPRPARPIVLPSQENSQRDDPMRIDATRFRKLSPDEKARRLQENLCLYCGDPGHVVKNCAKKNARFKINQMATPTSPPMLSENFNAQLQ